MGEGLFSSQGFPRLSQKLRPIPRGSLSRGLALVFPHVTLKHVPICCPPEALALPEAPMLSCIQLCSHSLGSWFRQRICLGSQEGGVLLPLWTPLPGGWIHLSLTGMMTMACSPVSQLHPALGPPSSPWLPEQQSVHPSLTCTFLLL